MPLSPEFMTALTEGHLDRLRRTVKYDKTLHPEIRDDTLSVYYRGGSLLKLQRQQPNNYLVTFDLNFLDIPEPPRFPVDLWHSDVVDLLPESLNNDNQVTTFLTLVPALKASMDGWLAHHPKPERECQQLLAQDNNFDLGRSTDYFICDTERAENFEHDGRVRFDFIAVHWPSTAAEKRNPRNRGFVIGEVKRGAGAIGGQAGLRGHMEGLGHFLANQDHLTALKEAMLIHFNQKQQLEFIKNDNDIVSFEENTQPPTWLLVIADIDPESTLLHDALTELADIPDPPVRIRIATANFMGYGLFDPAIYDLNEFRRWYQYRILCK